MDFCSSNKLLDGNNLAVTLLYARVENKKTNLSGGLPDVRRPELLRVVFRGRSITGGREEGGGWRSYFRRRSGGGCCKEALRAIDPLTAALSILEGVSSSDACWEMTAGLQAGRTR